MYIAKGEGSASAMNEVKKHNTKIRKYLNIIVNIVYCNNGLIYNYWFRKIQQ